VRVRHVSHSQTLSRRCRADLSQRERGALAETSFRG
jgi:hypothetical protein